MAITSPGSTEQLSILSMCGIATFIQFAGNREDASVIERMTDAVRHRGPDGSGTLLLTLRGDGIEEQPAAGSADWQVALGHRRLSILDLSDAGRQPMSYRDRLWITYNGEIYNYVELRDELCKLGHVFRSHSDTEVILAAYDQWGPACFERLCGMWGLVLVDGRRRVAILSRDRLGMKPLYLLQCGRALAIASEIKQFACVPGVRLRPDEGVLRDYLAAGYEQPKKTFFVDVEAIDPGTWSSIDLTTGQRSASTPFWFPERVEVTVDHRDEAARLFRQSLEESVRIHMRSDVPVGCALSGGLDSSSIAGCIEAMRSPNDPPLHTFSVVFPGSAADEQVYAERVARHIHSTEHYITPTNEDFLADLDRFVWIHDEPVGSLAQYACYALARSTRAANVPVTLNGQGGDEVLGGYWQSYFMHLRGLLKGGRLMQFARHLVGAVAGHGNPELPKQVPAMLRRYRSRSKALASVHNANGTAGKQANSNVLSQVMTLNEQQRRVYEVRQMYLPRLLKWDDRNFMAFGVEGRYPLLDHRLIETALSFDVRVLYDRGWTKEPLRRGLVGVLPDSVLRRRTKFGFETPKDRWLCGPLRLTIERWLAADNPIWQFTDRRQAGGLAAEVWQSDGSSDEAVQAVFRMYFADRWLRLFCD